MITDLCYSQSLKLIAVTTSKTVSGYGLKIRGKELNICATTENIVDELIAQLRARLCGQPWVKSTLIGSFKNWPVEDTNAGV